MLFVIDLFRSLSFFGVLLFLSLCVLHVSSFFLVSWFPHVSSCFLLFPLASSCFLLLPLASAFFCFLLLASACFCLLLLASACFCLESKTNYFRNSFGTDGTLASSCCFSLCLLVRFLACLLACLLACVLACLHTCLLGLARVRSQNACRSLHLLSGVALLFPRQVSIRSRKVPGLRRLWLAPLLFPLAICSGQGGEWQGVAKRFFQGAVFQVKVVRLPASKKVSPFPIPPPKRVHRCYVSFSLWPKCWIAGHLGWPLQVLSCCERDFVWWLNLFQPSWWSVVFNFVWELHSYLCSSGGGLLQAGHRICCSSSSFV